MPPRQLLTAGSARIAAGVVLLSVVTLTASCSHHASHPDSIMHNVALHADMNRETDLLKVENELTGSTYLRGSSLTILSAQQVQPSTPGLTKTWARIRVRLTDPYAPGAFGEQSTVIARYQLEYSYYGLRQTSHLSC